MPNTAMRRRHLPCRTAGPSHTPLPQDPDERCITIERVFEAADGSYWQARIESAFCKAGFDQVQVTREPYHPVWCCRMAVGSVDVPSDKKLASTAIRKVLKGAGLKVRADELTLLERRGIRLKIVFIFGSVMPESDTGPA